MHLADLFSDVGRCNAHLPLTYTDHIARKIRKNTTEAPQTPLKYGFLLCLQHHSGWDSDVDMSSCCTGYPHWEPHSILWAILMFPHSKATKWGIPHFEANPSGEGRRFSLADVTNNTINSTIRKWHGTWSWLDDWHGNRLNICLRGSSTVMHSLILQTQLSFYSKVLVCFLLQGTFIVPGHLVECNRFTPDHHVSKTTQDVTFQCISLDSNCPKLSVLLLSGASLVWCYLHHLYSPEATWLVFQSGENTLGSAMQLDGDSIHGYPTKIWHIST